MKIKQNLENPEKTWVSKAGEIRTLPKTSLPVDVLRVAKGWIP
jgi:hypothetical protein